MFSGKNMKRLTLVLLALFIIAFAFKLKNKKSVALKERSEIVSIDPSLANNITILSKEFTNKINISKNDKLWLIEINGKKVQADAYTINELLTQLQSLKPKQVISDSKEDWEKYELTEELGTRIIISNGKEMLSDIVLGKFLFDKTTNKMTSYVRNTKEKSIYAVDGYISMMFSRGSKSYRDNSVLIGNPENWNKLSFTYPADSSFTLVKNDNNWMNNDVVVDTKKLEEYFSRVRMLTDTRFEDVIEISNDKPAQFQLVIEGMNFEPIIINGYFINDVFITKSSLNKGNLFNANKLKRVLFVNKETFLSN